MNAAQKQAALDKLDLKLREALPEDLNFIFHSWISSFKRAKCNHNVPAATYFQSQHKIIERILRQSQTLLLVEGQHTANIMAYIVWEMVDGVFCVHYAYVKNTYRGFGLLRKLILTVRQGNSSGGFYTHDPSCARFIADKFNLYCNPYILHEYLKPLPPDTNNDFRAVKSAIGLD